jgi:putative ABC transport system permease protein
MLGEPTRPLQVGDIFAINDHRAIVVAITPVAPRFLVKPTVYTTFTRATTYAPPERNLLSFVLVRAKPGVDIADLSQRIQNTTGLRARTQLEFESDTVHYVLRNTPIIAQVGFMVGLGTIVGFAITGQLLYMFTHDNLRQYAALKAMGLPDRTLVLMVVVQALTVGSIGYGLGIGGSSLVGYLANDRIPFRLFWATPIAVGLVMAAICVVSAAVSAMKIMRLEPGIVFKA